MNSGNTLITTDGGFGDLAGSSVSLTADTPAGKVHNNASLALRRKGCFNHGGSGGAAPQRTACRYQLFVITRDETVEIHRRMLLQYGDSCLAQRKMYE
jgi:hypothetical protein